MDHLDSIASFRLVTADLNRLVRFYVEALGFEAVGGRVAIGSAEISRLGLTGEGTRQELRLGRQSMAIDQYGHSGRPYPEDGDASSPWFQHFALVTADIDAARARLGTVTPISTHGPELLPPSSGGVTAFKFRDPDGHPLELLQFTDGAVPDAWRGAGTGGPCLGIDHSAISVSDIGISIDFYSKSGLSVGGRTLNRGPAQEHLDGIAGVEVDVVAMSPHVATPHLELLGYRREKAPIHALQANDVAATRIVWHGDREAAFVDPDGHRHQVIAAPAVLAGS